MEDYESVALVKPEVFVFKIPPLTSNKGHRAAEWKLDAPDWTGRLKLVAVGSRIELRLEDKNTGALYAKCPVDSYPGTAIEPVTDSSRYFVIRLQNDAGRSAFVGCGFSDRGDSFDLNVALQDHFKYVEKSSAMAQDDGSSSLSNVDLAFKKGETITIQIGKKDSDAKVSRPRPAPATVGGIVPLLPPPPGSLSNPSRARTTAPTSSIPQPPSGGNLLDF